ncbi:MAG: hypothetical protein EZS28_032610 [Streblomastix strix]|uniref:Uncharacterized protein n=1 Tax=Streblomastix strix TaxID=222440 RepID=A0A5J4UNW7_9EUKA|nr:MAG: hypothetical protein EZS28_032610 [Streblomastix strix]
MAQWDWSPHYPSRVYRFDPSAHVLSGTTVLAKILKNRIESAKHMHYKGQCNSKKPRMDTLDEDHKQYHVNYISIRNLEKLGLKIMAAMLSSITFHLVVTICVPTYQTK